MSEHETIVQYIKIGMGVAALFAFGFFAEKIIDLLTIIAAK